MDTRISTLLAGLLLGGAYAFGAVALVSAALYSLGCIALRLHWIGFPRTQSCGSAPAVPDAAAPTAASRDGVPRGESKSGRVGTAAREAASEPCQTVRTETASPDPRRYQ